MKLRGLAATSAALALLIMLAPALRGAEPQVRRIEARSADLLAVALVREDHLSLHVTRLVDNAAVRDAHVSVTLRGAAHAAVAEADGGYSVETKDLELPGDAIVQFTIVTGGLQQQLTAQLGSTGNAVAEDKNGARQLWWWVLNFAVCIGFLMLWTRRRKDRAADD